MAQTYTLDEAAQRLGISPEALKRRLKEDWKTLRSFRDGPTLRFRTSDVDELARSLGEVSDPSLQLAPLEMPADPPSSGDFQVPSSKPKRPPVEEPILFDTDDPFSLSVEEPAPPAPKGKKGDSDSDVRLDHGAAKPGRGPGAEPFVTEEIDLDLAGPGSAIIREGSAAKLSGPKSSTRLSASDSNKNLKSPNLTDSSEFELSLDADSDDFELQMNADASDDEVVLGDLPGGKSKKSGESGINLRDPKDSGINLEKKKGPNSGIKPPSSVRLGKVEKPDSDSDLDFELSLDPPSGGSGAKLGGAKSGKLPPISDSDSEFELTLDDPSSGSQDGLLSADSPDDGGKNDIFETDFEIPPLEAQDDSGSEAVALEEEDTDLESSDFDLALDSSDIEADDESASQVVLLDDDSDAAAPVKPKPKRKPVAAVDEDHDVDLDDADVEVEEDEDSAAGALAGVKPVRYDEDEDDEDEDGRPVAAAAPVPWGALPAVFLLPAFGIMLLGGLIGYEMLQSMWGYHQPRPPAAPIVRGVAGMFDMTLKDQ